MKIILKLRSVLEEINNDVEVPIEKLMDDRKLKSALALYNVSHWHAVGISILLEKELYTPAAALLRPLYESYLKAFWLHKVATDEQWSEILKKLTDDEVNCDYSINEMPLFPKLDVLAKCADDEDGNDIRLFGIINDKMIKTFHSYTHSGLKMIEKNCDAENIQPTFCVTEITEIAQIVAMIVLFSHNKVNEIAGIGTKQEWYFETASSIVGWTEN